MVLRVARKLPVADSRVVFPPEAVLYFDSFAPGQTVSLRFRLRAKCPVRARAFQSRVYEYYDPEISSAARPIELEVRKR